MRKVIGIGISLLFFVCIAAQASSQNIHCWDLNENYDCDLETEDMNNDGRCNKRDCPREPEPRGVQVYDADGQYLGILQGRWTDRIQVFFEDLSIIFRVSGDHGTFPAGDFSPLRFQANDCSGTPFISAGFSYGVIEVDGRLYTGEKVAPVLLEYQSIMNSSGQCVESLKSVPAVPAMDITADMPNSPAALPLQFKYE